MTLLLIEPDTPNQSAYIEGFNARLRDDCLNERADTRRLRKATSRQKIRLDVCRGLQIYLLPKAAAAELRQMGVTPT